MCIIYMERKIEENMSTYGESNSSLKEFLTQFVQTMPNSYNIDDVMYELYVKKKVDEGLKDIEEGNVVSFEDIRTKFENLNLKND